MKQTYYLANVALVIVLKISLEQQKTTITHCITLENK